MDDTVQGAQIERLSEANGEKVFAALKDVLLALHEIKTYFEGHTVLFSKAPERAPLTEIFASSSFVTLLEAAQSPLFGESIEASLAVIEYGGLPESLSSEEGDVLDDQLNLLIESIERIRNFILNNASRVSTPEASDTSVRKHFRGTEAAIKAIDTATLEGSFLLSKISDGCDELEFGTLEFDEEVAQTVSAATDKLAPILN